MAVLGRSLASVAIYCVVTVSVLVPPSSSLDEADANGYITFCPCMGKLS